MAQITKSNSVTREDITLKKIYSDSDGKKDEANGEIAKSSSLTSLIIWNVTKALELNPKMDVKVAVKAAQARLEGDIKTIIPEYPEERHLACALLAWQQLGHSETDSLCAFVDNRFNSDTRDNIRKLTDKDVENSKEHPQNSEYPNKNLSKIDCYSMGPVIKLPTDPKIVMRLDTTASARQSAKGPKPKAPEQDILNKIDAACCMDSGCKERLQAMDAATMELRTRAAKLARREADRVELLERAEIAWKDLELGYQRRLNLAEEKEEDISKQIKKAVDERNNAKNLCMTIAKKLKEKSDLAEQDRVRLSNVDKEVVCDRACTRQRLSEESAKTEASLTEHQSKVAQFERDLTFKEEQLRRKMLHIESELESARSLTHEAERAMRAELAGLKDQVSELSKQLLKEDAESELIKELLTDMRQEKMDMIEDLEGCKKVCDGNMQIITDDLNKKRENLAKLKEQVMECRCKVPVDAAVEVKRTPSLAALCHCTAEDKILEACSCTSIRSRLLNNLLSDLFSGLQAELGGSSSADMPCQLLKCLEDKHNWDRSSIVKTNLKNYFSHLLLGELDIAITNSIEKYHARWLGETCADTIGKMTPDPSESASEEGWQQRVIEKRAQKLAAELAEDLFKQRADQLMQQAKEYVAKGPPPCDCKPANTDAAVYPCLVKTSPQLNSGPKTPPPWKEAMKDVTQLRMQIEDLKKDSIKKQDLKQMELKIAKIVKKVSCSENNNTDANFDSNVPLKRDQRFNRGYNSNSNVTQNKYGLFKKKLAETANKKENKLTLANNSGNDKHLKPKKFGQMYATNPCFCSQKEPNKVNQQNKFRSNGINYGICKPKTSFIVNNVTTSKLKGKPLPENCCRESPSEDKHPFVCFHKVPSNSSIDKLLETLAKWKTKQDQQDYKEITQDHHQSELKPCQCPATKNSSASLKKKSKPLKKHDCLNIDSDQNGNSRRSSVTSLKSKQSTMSLPSKRENKRSGSKLKTLAKWKTNQDQQEYKKITQDNRQSELIPCQCPAKKKSSSSLKKKNKPLKKHDCLKLDLAVSHQNENSRKSNENSRKSNENSRKSSENSFLKSKQSTTTTTSLPSKKEGKPSGCKLKTCASSTTKIDKKKTPSMCSVKACKSKEKTNRIVSVNYKKPNFKSTDSIKKVESEYMGAVNLDKSNEDACKCFSEKDKTKINRTINAPILPNNVFKCITSSKCNCDKVLKTRSNPSKDNANNVPLQSIQKDANKCLIQFINQDKNHPPQSDKNSNDLKPAPDCNYNIKFLGVTLADVNSKKQHVGFTRENDETQTSISTFDRYMPTDMMCTAECGCLVEPDFIQSVKKGGGETVSVCCISEQYKINTRQRTDTQRFKKIASCEYVEQLGEFKNFIDIALQQKCSYKDKSLDTQSFFIPIAEKENCVCCNNSYGDESKELEENTFHLLQEHLKQKLEEFKETSCQSSCIPPEEEERLFSTILQRVKKVISESTHKISCKCSDKGGDGQGSWSRAYGLLQEYLKMKIKRVQCSCVLVEDNKNTILPDVLEKVSNLIESDFKRLKDVCKCQRKRDVTNKDNPKFNFIVETPEKDVNIDFKTFSDKPNSRRSINQESVLLQVSDYFGLDAKSCDPMESQKFNVSQDVQSFQSLNIEQECNCVHKKIDSEILETLPYNLNKTNIIMETGYSELEKIKVGSKRERCLTVPLNKCNNDCTCNVDLSKASLHTRSVHETKKLSSKGMTKNDHFTDENYKAILDKSHTAKSSEMKNTLEQYIHAKPIHHICDDCHRKQCNQNKTVDVEMSLPNSPYIGCTIECSCENKLGKCVCSRATFKPNKEIISNVWKNSLQNKNYFDKVAYILNNNNVKNNDEKKCFAAMTNNLRLKTDQGSKQLDINYTKNGCETGISTISVEKFLLKNSNERFEIANTMTNTYDDDNSGNTDYSNNEESLDWCECSQIKSDMHRQLKNSISYPAPLQNNDDICKSESNFSFNEVKHPKHCNCDMVPICHVKMLVENIENKLASLKCTCDSLIPQVCPVHTLK